MGTPHLPLDGFELVTVPLIMTIARFPLVLDKGEGGIEVGFDSCVLMFLMCTLPPQESVLLWSLGVLGTQLDADKRTADQAVQHRHRHHSAAPIAAVLLSAGARRRRADTARAPRGDRRRRRLLRPRLHRVRGVGVARGRLAGPGAPRPARHGHRDPVLRPLRLPRLPGRGGRREHALVDAAAARGAPGHAAHRHPRGDPRHRERAPARGAVRGGRPCPDALRHPPGRRRAHRRRPSAAADEPGRGARHSPGRPRDRRAAPGRPARPLARRSRTAPGALDAVLGPAGARGDGGGVLRRVRPACG